MTNNNHKYEYMDEVSIDSELMCTICNKPYIEPVSTPCDHPFCRDCIKHWIEKKRKSYPICRQKILSSDEFTQVSRPLRNMLDRLQIKCSSCGQIGLQRDDFNDHINKVSPKVNISCSAADIKCPWSGLREELEKHLITCKFEPLRSLLTQLVTENQQLNTEKQQFIIEKQNFNEQIKQINIQINEITNKLSTINNVQPLLEKMSEVESSLTIDFSQQKITDRNAITSQGIIVLVDALLNNSKVLKDLWLSNNCISDLGVLTLTRTFLSNNLPLKHLHLGSNSITDRGIQHLVEILEINTTLTDLWLYNNQITDQGARNLAYILMEDNRSLKHLDLQWHKLVTDASNKSLVTMLEQNHILEGLNLRKCNLSLTGKMQLLQAASEKKDFKLII